MLLSEGSSSHLFEDAPALDRGKPAEFVRKNKRMRSTRDPCAYKVLSGVGALPLHTLAPGEEAVGAAEKPVMLLFTDPDCGPCTAMFPEIGRWQRGLAEALTISLVSRCGVEAKRARSTEHELRGTLLQQDWEVPEAYGVEGTPSAVLVRSDGTIGSPVLEGTDAISALLEYAVGERSRLPIHPEGQQG